MVSWGYAFDKGLVAFALVIVWQVLGFLIAGGISGGALLAVFENPAVFAQSFLVILIGLVIGGIVASIGTYATIIKISVESAQELRLRDEAAEEGQEFDEEQQTLDEYFPQFEKDVLDERAQEGMSVGTDFDRRTAGANYLPGYPSEPFERTILTTPRPRLRSRKDGNRIEPSSLGRREHPTFDK